MRKIFSATVKTIDEKNHIRIFYKDDIILSSLKFKIDEKSTPKEKPSKKDIPTKK